MAIFFILAPHVSDGDFWLHLRTGEVIVEDGIFPRTDILSFTNEGKEWINHEWLPQTIFYLLFKFGGFIAISLFTALAGTAIFALMMIGKKLTWFYFVFLFLIAYSLKPFIIPRPQIFAYLMLLGLVLAIEWYHRTKSKKIVFILPAILFLWANMHASVILALPILFFFLIFERERRWFLITTLLGVGLTFVNPFGYKIYWQALQPLRFSLAYNALLETQPIYKVLYQPTILGTHLAMIFVFLWHLLKKRLLIIRPHELVIFVLFMAMPFVAVKYTPFAWIAVLPIFLKALPDLNKKISAKLIVVGVAVVSAVIFIGDKNLSKNPHDEWPKEMVSFMRANNVKGNAYNPYSWSGYLSWEGKMPVFINGALANLGGDVFWDGLDFEKGGRVEEIINKYDLSVIISQPWIVLPYAISLKDGWSLVYWDNFGVVFLRKNSGNDQVIKKYGMEIKYFNDSVESVLKKYEPSEIPDLITNYEIAVERQPRLLLGRFRLGLIYQELGDCPRAIEQFKEIIKLDNKLGSTHFRLAECYKTVGDIKSALMEKESADKYNGKERWWKGRR